MGKIFKNETVYRVDHVPGEEIDLSQSFDEKNTYREFDEKGNLLLDMAFARDGSVTDKIEYHYDDHDEMTETIVYGEEEEILERKQVIRDKEGRLDKEITHYMDGSADIQQYYYNDKGILTGMIIKDDEDEMDIEERYYYEEDRLIKVERRDGENHLLYTREDKYQDGLLITRTIWSAEEEEPFKVVIEFNEAGRRSRELRYNHKDELVERNIYEEDEQGRVVRVVEENKARKNTTDYTYDDIGNVILQVETDLNGELNHQVIRRYDDEGHIITATVEAVMKPSGLPRAYTLVYKRELY